MPPRIGGVAEREGEACEPACGRGQQVEAEQAKVAPCGQQGLVAAEQPGELVGKADGHGLVETLALGVSVQRGQVARLLRAARERW